MEQHNDRYAPFLGISLMVDCLCKKNRIIPGTAQKGEVF